VPARSLGRLAGSALQVHAVVQNHPILIVRVGKAKSGLSTQTVTTALKALKVLGIVREPSGKRRGRLFGYERYPSSLNEGTGS